MYFRFDGKILDGIPLVARECGTWEGTCLREVGGGGGRGRLATSHFSRLSSGALEGGRGGS